jgi:hypothetical protein
MVSSVGNADESRSVIALFARMRLAALSMRVLYGLKAIPGSDEGYNVSEKLRLA